MFPQYKQNAPNQNASPRNRGLLSVPDKKKLDAYPDVSRIFVGDNASGTALVTDLNAITKSGFYNISTGTGKPGIVTGGTWWHVEHIEHVNLNGWAKQRAWPLDVGAGYWAERQKLSGSWQPWYYYGDVPWTAYTYNSYFAAYGGIQTIPAWRQIGNNRVEMRGLVKVIGAIGGSWGTGMASTLPATQKLWNLRYNDGSYTFGDLDLRISAAMGQLTVYTSVPVMGVNSFFSLDGLSYELS